MNYNDVVNRIKTIVEDHKMLVDFGYGQISDIKTRSEGGGELEGADYPYLFLNPTQHTRTQATITYNFNMIVMDMAREEESKDYQNFLNIQSDCIQYIDDIVARLYYYYTDKPEVSFDLTYTPFYERFQDDLAGATATLSIVVPNSINECIAPFAIPVLRNYNTLSCGILPLTTTHSWTSLEPLTTGSIFKDDFDTCWSIVDETTDTPIAAIAEFFTDCETCEATIIQPVLRWYNAQPCETTISLVFSYSSVEPLTAGTIFNTDYNPLPGVTFCHTITSETTEQPVFANIVDVGFVDCDTCGNSDTRYYDADPCEGAGISIQFQYTSEDRLPIGTVVKKDQLCYTITGANQHNYGTVDSITYVDCATCEATLPVAGLVLDVATNANYLFTPDTAQSPMQWYVQTLDTYNGIRPNAPYNYYDINAAGDWTFTLTGTVRRTTNNGTWPNSPNLSISTQGIDAEPNITNWPANAVIGTDYPFECTWTSLNLLATGNAQWRLTNEPAIEDAGMILAGSNLKGYYTA